MVRARLASSINGAPYFEKIKTSYNIRQMKKLGCTSVKVVCNCVIFDADSEFNLRCQFFAGGSETRFAAIFDLSWSNVATSCSRSMKSLHFASLYA